jgi:4-hydroxy-4-methyl-2-oxoglutarate aldolase
MIEEPPLLEIAGAAARPDPGLVAQFGGVPASFVVDALGGAGALDWRIRRISGGRLLGVALTCDCGPADNLALCAAVHLAQPGDVIVAATGGFTGTAVTGDILLGIARNRGAAGFVTDGLVRDRDDIQPLGLPVYAMGLTPNSPSRNGPGTVGLPVICGGARVATGDLVIGDADGIVIVPQGAIAATAARLARVRALEAELAAQVRAGLDRVGFVEPVLAGPRTLRRGG